MKMQELTQIPWLKKEIQMEEGRLENTGADRREKGGAAGQLPGRQRLLIRQRRERCEAELARLEQYISAIDDSMTRQIFVYRFACGMSWLQVANILGGGNTADGVKKRCQRWMAAHP